MATERQNFSIYSGDSVDIAVALTDADGAPLDTTGLTFWWCMGSLCKQSPAGIEVDDVAGTVMIHLEPADTAALHGSRQHQLRAIDPIGRVETLMTGTVSITQSVCQPTLAAARLRAVA